MKKLNLLFFSGLCLFSLTNCYENLSPREEVNIGAEGWKLWLDKEAKWSDDCLYIPPVNVDTIVAEVPTGGWSKLYSKALDRKDVKKALEKDLPIQVSVPGTVEEYCWDAISKDGGLGDSGDYVGVSWWTTSFKVPKSYSGKRLKLYFSEGVRQRAEVFVNEKLAGYELAHQLPFSIDITDYVEYGNENYLSVKITDANGNFSWGDYTGERWGSYYFPQSHGFGGILGEVRLLSVPSVHVSDVFVKNKPSLYDIDVNIELKNEGNLNKIYKVNVAIEEDWKDGVKVTSPKTIFKKELGEVNLIPSEEKMLTCSANVPNAKLWEIKKSNLYNWVTTISDLNGNVIDIHRQRFGFRFLSVIDHKGENPRFYFNGKRTTLISAISWGFWPVNGMYPTKELARKHLESASKLGMNMVNFHRCRGNELLLSTADEMGMLMYEEPGGFSSYRTNEGTNLDGLNNMQLACDLSQQRFLRMVKNDRNHPSLVYYNMVNEPGWDPDSITEITMRKSHAIDPTRFKSYGSGFMDAGREQKNKIHMIPYDTTLYRYGYCDIHNAGESQGVYIDENYNSPGDFERNTKGVKEIFVWGEEGAVASPPQLELIDKYKKDNNEINGWDGADYAHWLCSYEKYIKEKNLSKYYPSITNLITSMADVMYYEHGRFLENARITDDADLYVYNGYEDMKNDNFSGAVDVYRNIKGTASLMKQYAEPLYVAVKLREKVSHVGDKCEFDLYVINEHVLDAGKYNIGLKVETPKGSLTDLGMKEAFVSGGDKFSDYVSSQIPVFLDDGPGYYKIKAELYDKSGEKIADGHDEIFAVDWKNQKIGGKGAVLSYNPDGLVKFMREIGCDASEYDQSAGILDFICLGKMFNGYSIVPSNCFVGKDKVTQGLNIEYFRGRDFDMSVNSRLINVPIDFNLNDKLIPGYDMLGKTDFTLRWDGFIKSDMEGLAKFRLEHEGGAKIWIDDKIVVDRWGGGSIADFNLSMEKDKLYKIRIEACQRKGNWKFSLAWTPPINSKQFDIDKILSRVKNDGTVLFVMDGYDDWFYELSKRGAFPEYKVFYPAKSWVGSTFIVREHPFFEELPVNCAMNWEYQDLVRYDATRHFGLYDMKGEEPVVSVVGSPFHEITTSVGILPLGKGKIVFSSFDLVSPLRKQTGSSNVPKKVFSNYLKWAIKQ